MVFEKTGKKFLIQLLHFFRRKKTFSFSKINCKFEKREKFFANIGFH